MATRESIEFDLRQARAQAEKLDDIANSLGSLAKDKFGSSMQRLSQNWRGENADAYLAKGSALQGNISSSASRLHWIAGDIRTIAQNIYNAEMAALETAERRSYNNT
ncbi:MAG: hypothetical protein J6C19_01980 [Lachnospiraceae bacterium]|nr:hypothetical protein [Lachnospiraceae bacterium]